jgi:hypothetical protein
VCVGGGGGGGNEFGAKPRAAAVPSARTVWSVGEASVNPKAKNVMCCPLILVKELLTFQFRVPAQNPQPMSIHPF